jgi:hypothetical protein
MRFHKNVNIKEFKEVQIKEKWFNLSKLFAKYRNGVVYVLKIFS